MYRTFPIAAAALAMATPAAAYQAEIRRDDWGIAHIKGHSDADAVYGMIYAQAEDDFNRIEMNYLTNLGRSAEAEGESAIWSDLRQRLWIDPADLQAQYAKSPPWLRALMQGWAAGLNQYLADHPEVHPKVITHFEPWMALSFSEGSIGGDIENVPLSQLEAFYTGRQVALTANERGLEFKEPLGSNGFAIGPSHSANGHPLLLINPHTSFFFRSELQVESDAGLHAYGAVTWGQFFVYQGFNEAAGWMHTSSTVDNIDEFTESTFARPGGGFAYHYGKQVLPVSQKRITLAYRRADGTMGNRTFTTYATRHGPIARADGGKWVATALMNRPVAALQQSFLRTKVHSIAEFKKVAALAANSSNDTLFADSKGEFALFLPQFMPIRSGRFDYTKPVDGSNPATDWHGFHTLASLPQVVNPANGWVFNVNDGPWWGAGKDSPKQAAYPRYFDSEGRQPRTQHAIAVLSARPTFTLDSLVEAAYDPWMPSFAGMIPGLVAAQARHPHPARAEAVALLGKWDNRWSLTSAETSLAVFWGEALWDRGQKAAPAQGINVADWMAKASDEDQLAALDSAMARLKTDFGSWQVPWGEINRYQRNDASIVQTFDDAKPSVGVPFASAQWGSLAAFGAKRYPGTKRYYGTYGNSFVAAVEFGPRVRARAITAGGESGDPASPHFGDQVGRYAAGNLRPVYFWPEDQAGHIVSAKVVKGR